MHSLANLGIPLVTRAIGCMIDIFLVHWIRRNQGRRIDEAHSGEIRELSLLLFFDIYIFHELYYMYNARRGGAEVAGWTLDRKIRVRFPAYPHRVWALWWQGGKRRLRTSRCPCRGRLGTLKTPSCPWRGCPAAGQNLETGHLSRHYIAEISLNVTLNHNQQQQLHV